MVIGSCKRYHVFHDISLVTICSSVVCVGHRIGVASVARWLKLYSIFEILTCCVIAPAPIVLNSTQRSRIAVTNLSMIPFILDHINTHEGKDSFVTPKVLNIEIYSEDA